MPKPDELLPIPPISWPTRESLKSLLFTFTQAVAKSLDWIGVILVHLSTIPALLAVHEGTIDKLPSVEIVLFIWAGLAVWFARGLLQRDRVMILVIGSGFIIQAALMALILFK